MNEDLQMEHVVRADGDVLIPLASLHGIVDRSSRGELGPYLVMSTGG